MKHQYFLKNITFPNSSSRYPMSMTNCVTNDHLEVNISSCVGQVSSAEVQQATVRQQIFQDIVKSVALHHIIISLFVPAAWPAVINVLSPIHLLPHSEQGCTHHWPCEHGQECIPSSKSLCLFPTCKRLEHIMSCPLWLDRKLLLIKQFPTLRWWYVLRLQSRTPTANLA